MRAKKTSPVLMFAVLLLVTLQPESVLASMFDAMLGWLADEEHEPVQVYLFDFEAAAKALGRKKTLP
ncbi:MAG: hypothetical protein ACE3NC_00075 [Candidatus Wallacebacter cryptica]